MDSTVVPALRQVCVYLKATAGYRRGELFQGGCKSKAYHLLAYNNCQDTILGLYAT